MTLKARFTASKGSPARLDEPHVQLGVRLNAIAVQRVLASAAQCETEWRGDHRKRSASYELRALLEVTHHRVQPFPVGGLHHRDDRSEIRSSAERP